MKRSKNNHTALNRLPRRIYSILIIALVYPQAFISCQCLAQDTQETKATDNQDMSLVTVRGKLAIGDDWKTDVDWSEFKGMIVEQVTLLQPPFPDQWVDLTTAERQKWLADFRASDEGKQMAARNEEIVAKRKMMDFIIEADGSFVIYDVPQGLFNLQADSRLEKGGKRYLLSAFGQVQVGDVTEIDLSTLRVDVLRLLAIGERAPEITVNDLTGKPLTLSSLRGKHVLLVFGALTNPSFRAATDAMKDLQKSADVQDKLLFFMISVDEDKDAVGKFLQQQQIEWPCGVLGGWNQDLLSGYGLKSVPSFWLIDPQGNIVVTGTQFVSEINRQQTTIQKLVEDAVAGRLKIEPSSAPLSEDK